MELKARDESSTTNATTSTAEVLLTEEFVATRPVPIKGRRRNLGRQARKRRKKYLEIEAAFVAAATAAGAETNITASVVTTSASTTTESTETAVDGDQEVLGSNATATAIKTTVLPTDRGYVLDDVRRRTVLSEADRHDLIRQLGYLPGNALRVVARVEDAFSSDDLQRLVAAAAMVTTKTKTTTATQGESDGAKDAASSNTDSNSKLSNGSDNHRTTDTSDTTTTNCNDMQTNERKKKAMASMIQTMMKEPLVIKLYPLVLRDESSSTKRRRKRRRMDTEDDSTDHHNGASSTNKTPAANSISAGTTGTKDGATSSADGTVALPQTTPLMEPFPTIYWVTHPLIKALISKLELDRVNVQFEQRLLNEETERKKSEDSHPTDDANANDSNNNNNNAGVTCHSSTPLASMKRAHISYGRERRGLLSSRDMEYVKGRRWYDETSSSLTSPSSPPKTKTKTATAAPFSDGCGVAGIRNPKGVKCLHAHAAHYWSGNSNNVVGFWVWERLKSGCSFFSG